MTTPPSPASVHVLVAKSDAYTQLVRKRRGFVRAALALGLGWFTVFLVLAAWHPPIMGWSLHRGLTVAYALGFSQFLVVWLITWAYLHAADRVFEPFEVQALAAAPAGTVVAR